MEDKVIELTEFLAWVEDNTAEVGDDAFWVVGSPREEPFTREEIVRKYLAQKGEVNNA